MKRIWWSLVSVLVLLVGGVVACSTDTASGTFETVTPDEGVALIRAHKDDPNFVILDVRTPEEFTAGHIEGAQNIDFYAPDFEQQLAKLDKTKTYFVYCRSGNRSGQTIPIMKKLGFQHVYELRGGIAQWARQGLPLNP
nr:rhodanese-like domain-containing protein [Ardenticatena sp.]